MADQVSKEEVKGISDALKRVESRKKRKPRLLAMTAAVIILVAIAAYLFIGLPPTPPPVDLCENGVQDLGEGGIDCGGPCPIACPEPPPPYIDTVHVLPTSVSDIALDLENDRIYVLDEMRHRIMVFDSEFNHVKNFGETRQQTSDGGWNYQSGGITNDRLLFPASIYIANDRVYVLDRVPRIQVFTKGLEYEKTLRFSENALKKLPKLPDTPNADGGASSIAVSRNGDIYVADEVSNALAVFDSGLNLKKSISPGEENAPNMPRQIALGKDGSLYVADSANAGIKVFDSELGFVKSIGPSLLMPTGIAVSGSRLFVLDRGDSKLKVFDLAGKLLEEAGGLGTGPKSFYNPTVAKLDSQGNLYVVEEGNNRIQVFDSSLETVNVVNAVQRTFKVSFTPFYPAISPNGDLAFSDPINSKVFVLDKEFNLKATLGGKGFGNHQLNTPKGITFGSDGKLYVSDQGNRRIQTFSKDYSYLKTITHEELIWPLAISVSEAGKIYVVDDKHKKVLIFNQAGGKIGEIGEKEGITLPLGVLAEGGKIYITDDAEKTIEVFDQSLKKLKTISDIDNKVGAHVEFNESLAIDSKNRLLFCDNRNRSVVAMDLSTDQFSTFGSFGSGLQELSILEVAASGEIIAVADMEQHTVKVFDSAERQIREIGIGDLS